MHLLIYIDIALFIFIAFFIGYDLFFTLASFFRRRHRKHRSIRLQKFAVIFAAYKEDQVIQESVERKESVVGAISQVKGKTIRRTNTG